METRPKFVTSGKSVEYVRQVDGEIENKFRTASFSSEPLGVPFLFSPPYKCSHLCFISVVGSSSSPLPRPQDREVQRDDVTEHRRETSWKILNGKVGTMQEKKTIIDEGRAGFRPNHSLVDHVRKSFEVVQGRKDARLTTHCFFLHARKANETIRRNRL